MNNFILTVRYWAYGKIYTHKKEIASYTEALKDFNKAKKTFGSNSFCCEVYIINCKTGENSRYFRSW